MNVTSFVSGSALLLALWLGVTFFHQVSPLDNPNLPRTTATTNAPLPTTGEPAGEPATLLAVGEP
ncbi:MAG: hypothetical protein MUF04_13505 [Akkermansiaceae bacterium]|nr:hypothetical protein [Akkermansiaceae bacterium]